MKNFVLNRLETNLRLCQVISKVYDHPVLSKKLVLKGGSAVQCYLPQIERLFLDVDFDTSLSSSNFSDERQSIQKELFQVMSQLQYEKPSSKSRYSYSLDSFCFPYYQVKKNLEYLKVEINYSHGDHLYDIQKKKWKEDDFSLDTFVSVLSLPELMGEKIASLLETGMCKDFYDLKMLFRQYPDVSKELVKKSYLFYTTLSSKTTSLMDYQKLENITSKKVKKELYPIIPKQTHLTLEQDKKEVLAFLQDTLRFRPCELSFYERFQQGFYEPERLFSEEKTLKRAKENPIARYKIACRCKTR